VTSNATHHATATAALSYDDQRMVDAALLGALMAEVDAERFAACLALALDIAGVAS
jgi:hypothetical protein